MPKKEYLDFNFNDISFRAIAIHTALSPALLAWHTDRILGTKFCILPEYFFAETKYGTSEHTQYYFREDEFGTEWWLLENQGNKGLLLNVKPTPNMFLIGRISEDDSAGADWPDKLKAVQGMTTVYEMAQKEKKKMTWMAWLGEKKEGTKKEGEKKDEQRTV